jgi:glucose/arabinose dehydrogenase
VKRALLAIASVIVGAAAVEAQRWTVAGVPVETLTVPRGFSIAVYAEVPGARSMTLASDGTVFVGSQGDTVQAVVDRDHDGRADEVIPIASGLRLGNGVAFKDGSVFVADVNRILRIDNVLDFVNQPPPGRLGPHVAALGMRFYTGTMFPPQYRNQIFIAEHGSWNRATPIGYRLSVVHVEGNVAVQYETFAEGWLQGFRAWGRPVDLLVMPDGALLVSDDTAGVIYRITYRG